MSIASGEAPLRALNLASTPSPKKRLRDISRLINKGDYRPEDLVDIALAGIPREEEPQLDGLAQELDTLLRPEAFDRKLALASAKTTIACAEFVSRQRLPASTGKKRGTFQYTKAFLQSGGIKGVLPEQKLKPLLRFISSLDSRPAPLEVMSSERPLLNWASDKGYSNVSQYPDYDRNKVRIEHGIILIGKYLRLGLKRGDNNWHYMLAWSPFRKNPNPLSPSAFPILNLWFDLDFPPVGLPGNGFTVDAFEYQWLVESSRAKKG